LGVDWSIVELIVLDLACWNHKVSVSSINLSVLMGTVDSSYDVDTSVVVIEEVESGIKRPGFTTEGLESGGFTHSVTRDSTNVGEVVTGESDSITIHDLESGIRKHRGLTVELVVQHRASRDFVSSTVITDDLDGTFLVIEHILVHDKSLESDKRHSSSNITIIQLTVGEHVRSKDARELVSVEAQITADSAIT